MKVAVTIRMGHDYVADWKTTMNYVVEAERLGAEYVYTAEAWVHDVVSVLGFLAAKTERIELVSGIMQAGTRTPGLVAMTAQTLQELSDGRLILGLGTSGPQVIEGWHGIPFKRPLTRMREIIDVVRLVSRGERLVYKGKVYELPLPGGEGKAIRSPIKDLWPVPIYLGTLSPRSLELTGEIADGWIGAQFEPELADHFLKPIAAGAERAGRKLSDVDLHVGVGVEFTDDVDRAVAKRKGGVAFSMGAMGSENTNFYAALYRRSGYADGVQRVQELWRAGDREQAQAAVPDEIILRQNLIGTETMVRERLRAYRDAGISTIRVGREGATPAEWQGNLGRIVRLADEVGAEQPAVR